MIVSIYDLHDLERTLVRQVPLTGAQFVLGRDPQRAAVVVGHADVAPVHVRLTCEGGDLVVEPLAPGVRAGGVIVAEPRRVPLGTPLQIASLMIVVRPAPPERPHVAGCDPPYQPVPPAWRDPPAHVAWRTRLAADPTEHELLAAVRARPGDAAARMVYADWLEQHGDAARRACLLGETTSDGLDPAWSAIGCRDPIARCGAGDCPGRWDALTASSDERRRYCETCGHAVWFCVTPAELRLHPERVAVGRAPLSADRIDKVLRTVAPPDWRIDRRESGWSIHPAWCDFYTLRLAGDLYLEYGGTIRDIPYTPGPVHSTAVLPLAGLDAGDLAVWLAHAFEQLPATRDRTF